MFPLLLGLFCITLKLQLFSRVQKKDQPSTCKATGAQKSNTALRHWVLYVIKFYIGCRNWKQGAALPNSFHVNNSVGYWHIVIVCVCVCVSSSWFNLDFCDVWGVVRNHGKVWLKHRRSSFWLQHSLPESSSAGFS